MEGKGRGRKERKSWLMRGVALWAAGVPSSGELPRACLICREAGYYNHDCWLKAVPVDRETCTPSLPHPLFHREPSKSCRRCDKQQVTKGCGRHRE